jgi:hypothetical protein
MKAGTTSLHDYLDQHPQVSMSRPKELNFFLAEEDDPSAGSRPDWNFYRGVEWYAQHFDHNTVARGDVSPAYSNPILGGVAHRMSRVLPDAQLFFISRDPVARTFSHYQHDVARGRQAASFAKIIEDVESWYVQMSLYHKALAPFIREFGEGRIIHYRQEDLDSRPDVVLGDFLNRIGVSSDVSNIDFDKRLNTANDWRHKGVIGRLISSLRKAQGNIGGRAQQHFGESLDETAIHDSTFAQLIAEDQKLFLDDLNSGRIIDALSATSR